MATLLELVFKGELVRLNPQLDADEVERRWIYLTPKMHTWFSVVLPTLGSTWVTELTPNEQVFELVATYASGEPLAFGQRFKHLRHRCDFVWELKTGDVRLIGWFPATDRFVVFAGDLKERMKLVPGLYHGYAGEIERYVAKLDLNEPKFVLGEDPSHVVSNFYIPDPS